MTTATVVNTLKNVLTKADPNELPDALRKVDLGNMLTVKEYDTGTVSALTGGVVLPEAAQAILSIRVVSATTNTIVGNYVAGDKDATKLTAGTSGAVGVAALGADRKTLTFTTADVTRCLVSYIPMPATALTAAFNG
jgi:hypothetical protein